MERKYPPSLFFEGVLVSMTRHLFLFVPALFCLTAGIWSRPLRLAGLICLVADLVFSVIEQLVYMNALLNSDGDEDFEEFRNAMLSKNWRENVRRMMEESAEKDDPDGEDDDDCDYFYFNDIFGDDDDDDDPDDPDDDDSDDK